MRLSTLFVPLVAATWLGAAAPVAAQSPAATSAATTFQWNPTTMTFKYTLLAGVGGAKSPFNFNGFVDGELSLVVPVGSTVSIDFVNDDGVLHSAEVIADKDPMPTMGGEPAIPRAYTVKSVEGMAQGEKDNMRFKAAEAGTYRIFCGVPGHGLSGMWIRLIVDAKATAPRVEKTVKQASK